MRGLVSGQNGAVKLAGLASLSRREVGRPWGGQNPPARFDRDPRMPANLIFALCWLSAHTNGEKRRREEHTSPRAKRARGVCHRLQVYTKARAKRALGSLGETPQETRQISPVRFIQVFLTLICSLFCLGSVHPSINNTFERSEPRGGRGPVGLSIGEVG
jgi:hypothetical protein